MEQEYLENVESDGFNPIKDFWEFINFPQRIEYKHKVPKPFIYVNVLFVMAFFINMAALIVVNSFIVDLGEIGNVFDDMDYGFWTMFALAVIAAPIGEELVFRLPLRNKIALSVLLALILAIFVGVVFVGQGFTQLAYILGPASFVLSLLLLLNNSTLESWKIKIDQYYPYIFFLVAATFGFIHIYNYDPSAFSWWMAPAIVIPQFVLALFLGFARLRVGFWACIYMHALNNTIPMLMFYLVKDMAVG